MTLQGKLVRLREEREADLPMLVEMRNTLATQGWTKTLPPDYTLPMYEQRFRGRDFSFDRNDGRFIIEKIETGEMIGYLGYYGHEPRHSAIIGIAVAEKFWGQALAYDAQEVILEFLFEEQGLQVVRLWTNSGNPGAMKLAERSGFKVAARQRRAVFRRGQLWDNVVMDMLREEYYLTRDDIEDKLMP